MYLNVYRIIIIMITLMKKQFESKFQHYALAFKYNLNLIFTGERSEPENFLDFDISNMPVSEFWVTIGDRLIFYGAIEQDYFFQPKSEQGIFFEKKKQAPPPPPHRISNGPCLTSFLNRDMFRNFKEDLCQIRG